MTDEQEWNERAWKRLSKLLHENCQRRFGQAPLAIELRFGVGPSPDKVTIAVCPYEFCRDAEPPPPQPPRRPQPGERREDAQHRETGERDSRDR